ncbi:hypothetical protein RvY_13767 [Ramazzottius varieornatus]|uniref:Uncharacterized protein n=1 Tax=Ramazzottius varieornatus TaxID=947166 RepID=A0A1D1VP20_RAMVA|nr:hypothetical protein RvY_13767 [Ramazzottius varieornatus]
MSRSTKQPAQPHSLLGQACPCCKSIKRPQSDTSYLTTIQPKLNEPLGWIAQSKRCLKVAPRPLKAPLRIVKISDLPIAEVIDETIWTTCSDLKGVQGSSRQNDQAHDSVFTNKEMGCYETTLGCMSHPERKGAGYFALTIVQKLN